MGSLDALPLYLLIQNPSTQIPSLSLSPPPLTPSAALPHRFHLQNPVLAGPPPLVKLRHSPPLLPLATIFFSS